jgi:hypothetical protein
MLRTSTVERSRGGSHDINRVLAGKCGKIRIKERRKNFAYSVGTKVEVQPPIAVLHATVAANDGRFQERKALLCGSPGRALGPKIKPEKITQS